MPTLDGENAAMSVTNEDGPAEPVVPYPDGLGDFRRLAIRSPVGWAMMLIVGAVLFVLLIIAISKGGGSGPDENTRKLIEACAP